MLPAEPAVFLCLHTIGMSLLILLGVVVSVLALCAGKCDSGTHNFSSFFTAQKKDLISSRQSNISQPNMYVNRFFHFNYAHFMVGCCRLHTISRKSHAFIVIITKYHLLLLVGFHRFFRGFTAENACIYFTFGVV